ncbi:MAG: hypothetical protein ACE5LV_03585 [Candidatus Aminicenantales bacterium]
MVSSFPRFYISELEGKHKQNLQELGGAQVAALGTEAFGFVGALARNRAVPAIFKKAFGTVSLLSGNRYDIFCYRAQIPT